jgi:hypothetical protein
MKGKDSMDFFFDTIFGFNDLPEPPTPAPEPEPEPEPEPMPLGDTRLVEATNEVGEKIILEMPHPLCLKKTPYITGSDGRPHTARDHWKAG